jgi:hypothetical protein
MCCSHKRATRRAARFAAAQQFLASRSHQRDISSTTGPMTYGTITTDVQPQSQTPREPYEGQPPTYDTLVGFDNSNAFPGDTKADNDSDKELVVDTNVRPDLIPTHTNLQASHVPLNRSTSLPLPAVSMSAEEVLRRKLERSERMRPAPLELVFPIAYGFRMIRERIKERRELREIELTASYGYGMGGRCGRRAR